MAGNRSWVALAGAGLVWRRQRVLWWIFIVNLILAFFGSRGMAARTGEYLNHSMAAERLVKGFDLGKIIELASQPETPFVPAPEVVWFGVVFFIFMLFATGGILDAYRRDEKLPTGDFFEACGVFFWRFVRLLILLLIVLIPVGLLATGVDALSDTIDEHSVRDMMGFWFEVGGAVVVLFLLMSVRLWFDMAEVEAVARNERGMFRTLRSAFKLTWRNFGSLFWLYFRISLVAWVGFAFGLRAWMKYVRPESIRAAFLLGQILILFWIGTRLWQRASETLWYRRYEQQAATPEPSPPEPVPSLVSHA